MRKDISLWLLVAMGVVCIGCNRQQRATQKGDDTHVIGQDTQQGQTMAELPLPTVPSTIVAPEERAAYVIGHFWDAMDFRDTLRSHNHAFMEQCFVNFLSLFPHADGDVLAQGIDALMQRAAVDTTSLRLVNELAEHYLDDPNSPMRNEEYYILFLEGLLRLPALTEEERSRPTYLLELARKNRCGTVAMDFSYTDRNGRRHTLHGTKGNPLLLLFYDPACSHCTDILNTLRESDVLNRLTSDGQLTVLAVYTEGDRKLWDDTKDGMPSQWLVGIDNSDIVERSLYSLPAMPVIYLLDSHKTVLLKDPTPAELEAYLNNV